LTPDVRFAYPKSADLLIRGGTQHVQRRSRSDDRTE
jgi:hypothetical protein